MGREPLAVGQDAARPGDLGTLLLGEGLAVGTGHLRPDDPLLRRLRDIPAGRRLGTVAELPAMVTVERWEP